MFSIISLYSSYFTSISFSYLIIMIFTTFSPLNLSGRIQRGRNNGVSQTRNMAQGQFKYRILRIIPTQSKHMESSFLVNRTFEHFNSHDKNLQQLHVYWNKRYWNESWSTENSGVVIFGNEKKTKIWWWSVFQSCWCKHEKRIFISSK